MIGSPPGKAPSFNNSDRDPMVAPQIHDPFPRAKTLFAEKQFVAGLDVVAEALLDPQCDNRAELLAMRARVLFAELNRPLEGLEVIEDAYRSYPDNEAVLRVLARLRHALRPPSSAFNIYKRLYRGGEATVVALDGLFKMLMEAKRYSAAARLAPQVTTADPMPSARARDLAELAIARRDPDGALAVLEAAGRASGARGLDQLQIVAEHLKAELAAGDTMAGYRHLAIAGTAFCGSTTLGVILGSMPGFAFAGETHWLTNTRGASDKVHSIRETDVPILKWPIACRVCGRACEYFDVPFRVALANAEIGWYAKIADRLGVKNLVTADKNTHYYLQRDPLCRFDYMLSYKSPENHLRSMLKQELRRPSGVAALNKAWAATVLDRWADNYMGHLRAIRPTGRRVVLNWDGFAAHPAAHMRRLSELLDIPLGSETLTEIRLGHFIGGNIGLDVAGLRADPRLTLRPSNAPELPPDLREAVLSHRRAQAAARMLAMQYRRDFGSSV